METTYHVSGMTCQGCVKAVSTAVSQALPTSTVRVDLTEGTMTVDGAHDSALVRQAVEAAGFDFVDPQQA